MEILTMVLVNMCSMDLRSLLPPGTTGCLKKMMEDISTIPDASGAVDISSTARVTAVGC